MRCWPGGLCLSRSIGDTDVGEFIVPIPHVKQVKVSLFSNCDLFSAFSKINFEAQEIIFWLFSFQMLEEDLLSLPMVSGMLYLLIWLPSLVGVYLQSLLQSWLLR